MVLVVGCIMHALVDVIGNSATVFPLACSKGFGKLQIALNCVVTAKVILVERGEPLHLLVTGEPCSGVAESRAWSSLCCHRTVLRAPSEVGVADTV